MIEYRNGRSRIIEMRSNHLEEHALFYHFARTDDVPFADSAEEFAKDYPEAFIRGLGTTYRRGPNAYNASS